MGIPSLCVKMLNLSHYRPQYVAQDIILQKNVQVMYFKYHHNSIAFPAVLEMSVGSGF